MAGIEDSDELRAAMFAFLAELQERLGPYLKRADINGFAFHGRPLSLMEQKGICKPRGWAEALTITSTSTPTHAGGYEDEDREDGSRLYRYMRDKGSAAAATNASLDALGSTGRPLAYFVSVGDSYYEPIYPVFVTGTESTGVIVSESAASGEYAELIDIRRYQTQDRRVRLHQREFRSRVLFAYEDRCCICAFRHRGLLDAAHIVDDADERGHAVVSNGLALCRMHHGAYDQFLLGISPEHRVEVHPEVLDEQDGPMLQYGLQKMHGSSIALPRKRDRRPSREGLAWKYDRFRATAS